MINGLDKEIDDEDEIRRVISDGYINNCVFHELFRRFISACESLYGIKIQWTIGNDFAGVGKLILTGWKTHQQQICPLSSIIFNYESAVSFEFKQSPTEFEKKCRLFFNSFKKILKMTIHV